MRQFVRNLTAVALVLAWALSPIHGQFGQNKITYGQFKWKLYQSPHFDVHYYEAEEAFLEDVVSYAESAYVKLSKAFDHELRWRVPLVIYKNHSEFQQTNIQLSEIPESTLAFAEPIQNRMVLPIDTPPDFLYALITHELTHIFEFSFFFEGYLGRALRASPPRWLMEGLASYMADDESNIDKMVVRDAVVNNVLPPIQALDFSAFFAYRYGHAVFDYIEQEHGQEGLRGFIFEYRKHLLTGNIEKAVQDTFGYDVDEFNRRFNRYLRKKYLPVLLEKKSPDDYGKEISLKKRRGIFTFSPTLSPSGELIAALSAPKLELDLVTLSAEDGSVVKNVTKGWTNKYESLVAQSFQGKRDLSWSPVSDDVAVFVRKENRWPLLVYNALNGKLVRNIDLGDIVQATSPAFSPDGTRIAFEGNLDGVVDIFEYNVETGEIRNMTADDQFDTNPWYSKDGRTLLYNRRIGPYWKIFSVDTSDPSRKIQITFGSSSDLQPSYSKDEKTIYFSSDRGPNGVFNVYSLELETGDIAQYTDVVGGCFSPMEMADRGGERQLVISAYFEGTFRLYRLPLGQPESRTRATERIATEQEVEPFEPPLQLTVDEDKKADYKVRWDLAAPLVSVGVTDDGTFLSNAVIQFTDLLGDQRIQVLANSVSSFANMQVSYVNFKRRTNWGGSVFDFRDYFTDLNTPSGSREQIQRTTGANFFVQHPLSRHYRIEAAVGFIDQSQDFLVQDSVTGQFGFFEVSDRFGTLSTSLVGDTTRHQSFGPFQGKRFNVGVFYGLNAGGDVDGDILEYRLDFRAYRQATRRSLLAWRLSALYGDGDRQNFYSLGGINQLRGFDFRDFFGSRVAWSNLEFRFPLIDELRFPIMGLRNIRGFFFLDVGAAWFKEDFFFDPEASNGLGDIRTDPGFSFWDSERNQLQDGRASYGFGLQFFFLGGLQFNWAWANVMDYTQFVPDPDNPGSLIGVDADTGGRRVDFYIVFDF